MFKNSLQKVSRVQQVKEKLETTLKYAVKSAYEPKEIEADVGELWEAEDSFKPSGEGESYCIMQPPPNVTGVLHMGHAFQTSLMDAQIRYNRMKGRKTLWQPGVDHAGIATQMVVENQLRKKNLTREDLGRERFVDEVWKWKEQSGSTIVKQFHRLGASADWSRSRFTMDEGFSEAVLKVFVTLYDEGLIYRGQRLVNWDPVLRTAVSDLEAISEEEEGSLWHMRYALADGTGFLVVATTRPETLFGDTAVAVNPKDERYTHMVGAKLILPLSGREIPIIADEMVDPAFGTGCVKITPAHDFNDFSVSKRHDLPLINILTEDAHLNENVPVEYQGLDRFEARKRVVTQLQEQGILERIEPYKHKIPRGEKSGAVVEPRLTTQWYLKTEQLAAPAIEAVEQGKIKFVPESWSKTYFHWMNNIQDWCISRQLWWGHRIPAWYDEAGNIYVGMNEMEVRQKYHLSEEISLKQDNDVLDTWFSAGLWPFVTLGWPEKTAELSDHYPTNVLVTGFDIIFFWVARMIMFGQKFTGEIPFKEVYITGLLYDKEGKKMSKTKGNVLDPIDLIDGIDLESLVRKRTHGLMLQSVADKIEKSTRAEFPRGIQPYGTDALRFSFILSATVGSNINFNIQQVEKARNFSNKIWNATKYVLQRMEMNKIVTILDDADIDYRKLNVVDRWMLSRLQRLIAESHINYETYRYDMLARSTFEFIWNDFCDWYLEFSKPILETADEEDKLVHSWALVSTLENWLKLLHPMMPFITEGLWQMVKPLKGITRNSIMLEGYPLYNEHLLDLEAEMEIEWLKNITIAIRSIRGENKVAHSKWISILLKQGRAEDRILMEKHELLLKTLSKIENIEWIENDQPVPPAMTSVVGNLEIYIPLADLVDRDAEIIRLNKEIKKQEVVIDNLRKKVENPEFVQKAPLKLIEKERARLIELEHACQKIKQQLELFTSGVKKNDSVKSEVRNSDQGYTRYEIEGDEDCGYSVFGVTREKAVELLLANISNISHLIKTSVKQALLTDDFSRDLLLDKKDEQMLEAYSTDSAIQNAYIRYDVQHRRIDAGFSHPAVLQALAHIKHLEIHMWKLGENNVLVPHTMEEDYSVYRPDRVEGRVDLLFVNGNHFERLELRGYGNDIPSEGIYPCGSSGIQNKLSLQASASLFSQNDDSVGDDSSQQIKQITSNKP